MYGWTSSGLLPWDTAFLGVMHFLTKCGNVLGQVKKAGAIDASSVESEAEMAAVARMRKPTIIAVSVIFFLSMIVWPLLTLPAGVFR